MDSFDEHFIDSLVRVLVLHKEIGLHLAWDNWNSCLDPDGKLKITSLRKRLLDRTRRKTEFYKKQLSDQLDKNDFDSFIAECSDQLNSYREIIERKIEMEYRPSDVYFNNDALINSTDLDIPEDIQICLSFGYKFLSPYSCHDKNMHSILAQLDQCIDESIPDLKILEASIDIYRVLSPRSSVQNDDTKNWLAFIAHRTQAFFKTNPHVFATKSDKGGHTVVISIPDYEHKLQTHLSGGNYSLMNHDPLLGLIDEEKEIVHTLGKNKKLNEFLKENRIKLKVCYEPNTLNLPKFYGLPKIHKEGTPLRPITSTIGSAGYYLAKLFDRLLNIVFPRTEYHIKDTYEFVKFIVGNNVNSLDPENPVGIRFVQGSQHNPNGVRLKTDEVLVSFDVVSMFTSIPFELVFDIIMSKAEEFQFSFDIDRDLLARITSFLLKDCMVFTALDKIYKQNDGIPMGSCLSPTVARLVMDKVILHLFARVPQISFIKVFVDDTIAAVHKDCVDLALEALNDFRPDQIKFTLERENDAASINFLNVTLTREATHISTNWFRKSFASGRLLNHFSSHKRTTVIATAIHFIRTVLILSDHRHFESNKSIVFRTLRDNSFPETVIITLMNDYYTLMKPLTNRRDTDEAQFSEINVSPVIMNTQLAELEDKEDKEEKKGYKIFPHSICEGRRIKKVIHTHKAPRVILADSVRNTRINAISTRKTIVPIEKRKNLVLISRCKCRKKYKIVQTNYDETGEMARSRILTHGKQKCDKHGHAYRKAKFLRGLFYDSQTKYLVRYIAWKYRHALDFDCQPERPNDRLRKLVKRCSCCRSHPQQKVNHRAQSQITSQNSSD